MHSLGRRIATLLRVGGTNSALLLFLYNTGARADEAAQVSIGDLRVAEAPRAGTIPQCRFAARVQAALLSFVDAKPGART